MSWPSPSIATVAPCRAATASSVSTNATEGVEATDLRTSRHRQAPGPPAPSAPDVCTIAWPAVHPELAGEPGDRVVRHGKDDQLDLVEECGRLRRTHGRPVRAIGTAPAWRHPATRPRRQSSRRAKGNPERGPDGARSHDPDDRRLGPAPSGRGGACDRTRGWRRRGGAGHRVAGPGRSRGRSAHGASSAPRPVQAPPRDSGQALKRRPSLGRSGRARYAARDECIQRSERGGRADPRSLRRPRPPWPGPARPLSPRRDQRSPRPGSGSGHPEDPPRERPPPRRGRDRRGRRRRAPRRVAARRRRRSRDPVHALSRRPRGLHRRPGDRGPRRHARCDGGPRRRSRAREPPASRPTSSSTTRSRWTPSGPRRPSPSTSTGSTSGTASATSSSAGRRRRSGTSAWSHPGRGSSTRSTPGVPPQPSSRIVRTHAGESPSRDTLVGTDSHTTMINGLGVGLRCGWHRSRGRPARPAALPAHAADRRGPPDRRAAGGLDRHRSRRSS